ncbi:MAG: hypothetical protein NZM31_10345 [Gemmatales bacterium]|nr:hypothetical protein [Gemmatales bacterium]MDW8387396.1 hypothetical protein [Gemmatales bacterium]
MRCRSPFAVVLFTVAVMIGCQTPESAVQPLPPDAQPLPYSEMHARAKAQVAAAQEFFYRDTWREVEQAAVALQQTADLIGRIKPEDLPMRLREQTPRLARQLRDAAMALEESARAKDVIKTTQIFQTLNLTVREMRPE